MMRSAWIKWARGVEHQAVLAREGREFDYGQAYAYSRTDNARAASDPLLSAQWRLKILKPFPERWGVLAGDVLTNLRAALDHTFWTAVMAHSGPPPNPHLVTFPLATENSKNFKGKAKDLRPLVAPEFWDLVEACQPFQAEQPQDMPLEWLRWLSNADKHRAVRVIGQMAFDAGPIVFTEGEPFEIVDEKRFTGPVEDNAVVARVKIKRPVGARTITLRPTFAYSPALQVGEDAELIVPLHVVMEEMTQDVLVVISNATTVLGEELPDPAGLEVGTEHASVAAENSGVSWFFRDYDGTSHRMDVPAGEAQTGSQE